MAEPLQVLEPQVADPILDEGDHDRMTHIVLEGFHLEEQEEFVSTNNSVVEGTVFGTPVKALCGKQWVPGRNPGKYPICPSCKEIAESLGWSVPSV